VTGSLERAAEILRTACGDRVREGFPMAPLTTFRIGGPAALYFEPESEADLEAAAEAVRATGIAFVVVGKGSNLLVSDRGFEGLALRLGRGFRWVARDGDRLTAGSAMPLPALAGVALSHGLSGLEFGVAIPASFGGAVRMNAGAHGRELSEVLETLHLFALPTAEHSSVSAETAGFGYRSSELPPGAIVTEASIRLEAGDRAEIRSRMDEVREWRRVHQPLAEPSCGSVFKNPPGGHAARLIDEAGAKGMRVGGATVSLKHANFIVAADGSLAADVVTLIRSVQELVEARFDILLEAEVHLVGAFDLVPR
jgi:UDP-N-acetylmuramate dehydrogenase